MIKITYLENNFILVNFNKNKYNDYNSFIKYINILYNSFKYSLVPYLGGGYLFHIGNINKLKECFLDIEYTNKYVPPSYSNMGEMMKLSPYDYQKEAIEYVLNNHNGLLLLPCGSGKTTIIIGSILELKKHKIINNTALIIVKASLKYQWQEEIKKFSDLKAKVLETYADCTFNINNRIKSRQKKKTEKAKMEILELEKRKETIFNNQFENEILILNYETLLDDNILNKLLSMNIDAIFCDEIQYIKSKDAERSKALYKLNSVNVKIGATATPITKDPRDLFGLFNFIKPEVFENYKNFSKRYINFAGYGRINGIKNKDELFAKIKEFLFIKTKYEVASQLPTLSVFKFYIESTIEQVKKFEEIQEQLKELNMQDKSIRMKCKSEREALLNKDLQNINGKVMALQTFAQELVDAPELLTMSESNYSKQFAINSKNPKLAYMLELVDQIISSGEKVAIFSKFQRMQEIITNAIHKKISKDIKIAYINGSLNPKERYNEAYTKFRDNDDYKVLLLSDSGAEGLNLSKCKYLIEYDIASSYALQTQRHGRIERSDSIHKKAIVYQLINKDSWDEIALKIVEKKKAFDNDLKSL